MKLARYNYDPMALADFFEAGVSALGGVCERTWHNRLQVLAEGPSAKPWNDDGSPVETEIHFHDPGTSRVTNAAAEAFPGCPLTFRLAETLCASGGAIDRIVLRPLEGQARAPARETAERLWHEQMPGCSRWRIEGVPSADWHFSLLALVRCEIQASDQHWSLHRLTLSLPDGRRDSSLASALDLAEAEVQPPACPWPPANVAPWREWLRAAVGEEIEPELAGIRTRQESYLRRELGRIDDYFDGYEHEIEERRTHSQSESVKAKMAERLEAAQAERVRRRQDQVQRHEIRVIPHLDALCLLAEPAWRATISFFRQGEPVSARALLVPRSRTWIELDEPRRDPPAGPRP